MLEHLLIASFFFFTLLNLGYWIFVFTRLASRKPKDIQKEVTKPVSVVICARNEAENLKQNLPLFLQQEYPDFEVLVVDDGSDDNSLEVLAELAKTHPNLQIKPYEKPTGATGKKWALQYGIQMARHDLLLLSDADCMPNTSNWIQGMANVLKGEKAIGLGYSPMQKKKGILNAFIRFETVYTAIQYFSFSLIGRPYMGVGRNLIYHKDLFNRVGRFDEHLELASGD